MMMRDYKMYTYEGGFTYSAHVRDDLGDITGQRVDVSATFKEVVVARSRAVADAWVQERHNADYLDHEDFEFRLIDEQPAPQLLIEWTA